MQADTRSQERKNYFIVEIIEGQWHDYGKTPRRNTPRPFPKADKKYCNSTLRRWRRAAFVQPKPNNLRVLAEIFV